jgi:hypothetical protein
MILSERAMLRAVPHGIFSWDFTIFRQETAIADIDMSMWRERAELRIAEQIYSVYRESRLKGTFVLRTGDLVLARAQKGFTRTFDIDVEGRHMELKAFSFWTREFGLFENNALIGRIGPSGWLGRKAIIGLPGSMSLPVQVFFFWLVLILWCRAAQHQDFAALG